MLPVDSLGEAVDALKALNGAPEACGHGCRVRVQPGLKSAPHDGSGPEPDFADVVGQGMAKRALEIAAAGGHNMLLIGAPGGGKTMMARRCRESFRRWNSKRRSIARRSIRWPARCRPATALMRAAAFPRAASHDFRGGDGRRRRRSRGRARSASRTTACCFSTSCRSSIGACSRRCGNRSRKGGSRSREPRARPTFPSRFMLVAAMNPCPCGFHGDRRRTCQCSGPQIERYAGRISGPLRDRIDLVVEVPPSRRQGCTAGTAARSESAAHPCAGHRVRDNVSGSGLARRTRLNRQLEGAEIHEHCALDDQSTALLEAAIQRFCLSARGSAACCGSAAQSRIWPVWQNESAPPTLAEALQYRIANLRQIFAQLNFRFRPVDKLC